MIGNGQRPAVKDAAQAAGVPVASVSRTLADPDGVRPKTRERVQKAFRESETNTAFEQRVYEAVSEAASQGRVGPEQLSDQTLGACLAALLISAGALKTPVVRAWLGTELDQHREDGAPK